MKKIFNKTWFKIIFFGAIAGVVFIWVDEKLGLFKREKRESSGTYNGPVKADKDKTYFTEISFNETAHDFGKVKEGDTLSYTFKVTNKGQEPLVIFKSAGSCDCVAAEYPKDMIAPGKEITITAHFDTKGRKGVQNRTITLTCNTEPADVMITLKADVE
jgi:hypothetical protein